MILFRQTAFDLRNNEFDILLDSEGFGHNRKIAVYSLFLAKYQSGKVERVAFGACYSQFLTSILADNQVNLIFKL